MYYNLAFPLCVIPSLENRDGDAQLWTDYISTEIIWIPKGSIPAQTAAFGLLNNAVETQYRKLVHETSVLAKRMIVPIHTQPKKPVSAQELVNLYQQNALVFSTFLYARFYNGDDSRQCYFQIRKVEPDTFADGSNPKGRLMTLLEKELGKEQWQKIQGIFPKDFQDLYARQKKKNTWGQWIIMGGLLLFIAAFFASCMFRGT